MTAPPWDEASAGRWAALLEALLRGVGHALSNRVAGLLALSEIPVDEHDAESLGLLPHEAERLQDLLRLVKLLPAERGAVPGALLLDDVLGDGRALMSLHPTGREVAWRVAEEGAAQPVRVERWVLLRALLLLMDVMRERAHAAGSRTVELRVADVEQGSAAVLCLAVVGPSSHGAPVLPADDPYLASLVRRMGGNLDDMDALTLRLPTLAELRRRGE